MSLEIIQKEIEYSVHLIKQEITEEWDAKINQQKIIWSEKYILEKQKEAKLIEKKEEEKYIKQLTDLKIQSKKNILQVYEQIVNNILKMVEESLINLLGVEEYYSFMESHIKKLAEAGDCIYISAQDFEHIGEKLKRNIPDITIESKQNLKSGFIIEKSNFNYNLSSLALIEENYSKIEQLIGKLLYE